ncbi:MAG TPA: hypothetical protein VER11_10155 [Polyangiaceae bacterium]|nr:hypothetical protein [Polyangiaceae bacterium]
MTAKKPGKGSKATPRLPAKASGGKLITLAAKKGKRKTQPKIARKGRKSAALEVQLRKTVAELGLTEARKIFASVEAAFDEYAPL